MTRSLLILAVAGLLTQAAGDKPPASSRTSSRPASRPHVRGKATPLDKVTKDMVRKSVVVEGEVIIAGDKPSRTRKRIYIYTLEKEGHTIEVVWWDDLHRKLSDDQHPQEGDMLRVRGEVTEYRRKMQIVPKRTADIEVIRAKP